MRLAADLYTIYGDLLVRKDREITPTVVRRIREMGELHRQARVQHQLERAVNVLEERLADRVGNVVEFKVEKDVETHAGNCPDAVRSAGTKHLQTDLCPAHVPAQPAQDGTDFNGGRSIKDED